MYKKKNRWPKNSFLNLCKVSRIVKSRRHRLPRSVHKPSSQAQGSYTTVCSCGIHCPNRRLTEMNKLKGQMVKLSQRLYPDYLYVLDTEVGCSSCDTASMACFGVWPTTVKIQASISQFCRDLRGGICVCQLTAVRSAGEREGAGSAGFSFVVSVLFLSSLVLVV